MKLTLCRSKTSKRFLDQSSLKTFIGENLVVYIGLIENCTSRILESIADPIRLVLTDPPSGKNAAETQWIGLRPLNLIHLYANLK